MTSTGLNSDEKQLITPNNVTPMGIVSNRQPETIFVTTNENGNCTSKCLITLLIVFIMITIGNTIAIGFLFYNDSVIVKHGI